ncbi:MAG: hypothetical protein P4L96_14020 [Rhodoferax sp.]|nr:hypothetical protein [Rhodoferax sp.]
MKTLLRFLLWALAVVLLLGAALTIWVKGLAKDDGGAGRPTYGSYSWAQTGSDPQAKSDLSTPRGGPRPRADGYVMGSLGNDFILPPMPPERSTDIARKDNVFKNAAIKNCFWPGPKLRTGYYTTDPDDYGEENQLPDIGNTFSTAWFKIPEGAKIVMKGNFPHMRHWSYTTYTEDGVPRDVVNDIDIDPDAGSSNPFRAGVRRDVEPRRYTVSIANGEPPAQRPPNTVYTKSAANTAIGMHMRNYVPDRSIDWTGGVGVPDVELHLADGKVLKSEEACAATAAPLRGKQVPLTVSKRLWLALNSLPWRPADRTPASNFEVAPMVKFYNREHLLMQTFFPAIPSDFLAVEKGGFWSNLNTRYGYTYLSQAYGKVYVVHGKMPSTPHTWDGDPAPMDQNADMRYWSLCTVTAPAVGNTVDCVTDENVRSTIDKRGNYSVVVSRASDRPANATEKCGVTWMEYGNGDGIPGGSQDFGAVLNRHTDVNPKFQNSWFNVKKLHGEQEALGAYLPHVINMHEKDRFEALGCPVDTSKFTAMIKP